MEPNTPTRGVEEPCPKRYERLTKAYLPTASVAFLDEIFKANSAILNALLTLLNEREFDNGTRRESTPLIAAIGASNELPNGEELDALFDRFLIRCHVGYVSKHGFASLLGLRGDAVADVPQSLRLSAEALATFRAEATHVVVPDDVVVLLGDLRDWCTAAKIEVSDRRWRKVVKLLQTAALSNGRRQVSIWDCWLLQHCLWNEPEQRAQLYDWYAARVGASAAMDPSRLTRVVVSWEAALKRDQDSRTQARDGEGNLLFKSDDGTPTTVSLGPAQAKRGQELLFLAPSDARRESPHGYGAGDPIKDRTAAGKGFTLPELDALWVRDNHHGWLQVASWPQRDAYLTQQANWCMKDVDRQPVLEPTRQKATHIASCVAEVEELERDVGTYKERLLAHIASLDAEIRTHLWVTDDFAEPAARSLDQTRGEVETLLARIAKLRRGFEMLPREDDRPFPERIHLAEADARVV